MRTGRLAILLLSVAAVWAQVPGPGFRPPIPMRGRGGMEQPRPQAGDMQGTASVEGTIIHRRTGEPIARAMVYLQKSDGSQGLSMAAGADGKFRFENVARGDYRVMAERRGFLRGEYGSRRYGQRGGLVNLTDGQEIKGADVKLDPQSVISGRILDEHGEPMDRVQVLALKRVVAAGQRQSGPAGMAQTDDRGEFRIAGLGPGRYYIQAQATRREMMMQGRNIRRVDVEEPESYVATYFPGTTESSAATPVELGVGQEFLGLSLQVQRARVFKVSGTVQGVEPRMLRVMAIPRGRVGFGGGNMSASVRQDGGFELSNLTPGSYTVTAMRGGPGGGTAARAVVDVRNADVEGVNLLFAATFSVQGTIKFESGSTFSPGNLRVMLRSENSAPNGQTKSDGAFTIENVTADRYRFAAMALPRGTYIKSVRVSGQDVTRQEIDFTSGAAGNLEVILGNKPATVSGTITKAGAESLPGLVIVVPDGAAPVQSNYGPFPGSPLEASVDQNGAFSIQNVPPGDYRVYAFEEFDRTEGYDPEFLKKFESSSEKLKLSEGDAKTLSLKQIPSSAEVL